MSLRLALKRSLGSRATGNKQGKKRRKKSQRELLKRTLVLVCPDGSDDFDPAADIEYQTVTQLLGTERLPVLPAVWSNLQASIQEHRPQQLLVIGRSEGRTTDDAYGSHNSFFNQTMTLAALAALFRPHATTNGGSIELVILSGGKSSELGGEY
jgi:hypothetical protein